MHRAVAGFLVITLALPAVSQATTFTWDANGATTGVTDGAGAWLDANQWWDGTSNVTWNSGDDAVFGVGGTGGAVTLSSTTAAGSLTLNPFSGTYTIGTAGQTLTLDSGGLTMNAGAGAVTLASPVTLSAPQSWTNNSSSLLTASGAITNGGNLLTVAGNGSTTISGSIAGSGGLTKSGGGTLLLSGANAYTGGTTVTAGTLEGTQVAGTPFGTGGVTVAGGRLAIKPFGSGAVVTLGNAASAFTFGGGTLALDRGSNTSLTYEVGSMAGIARGSLVITESIVGALGSTELFKAATAPGTTLNANLVNLPAVVQHPDGTADFLRYDATDGLVNTAANYRTTTGNFTPAANDILNVTTSGTIQQVTSGVDYTIAGLRVVNATLTGNGGTSGNQAFLDVNNQSGTVAPVILDNGSIASASNFRLRFGSSEGAIYVTAGGGVINAVLAGTAGYTKYGPGTLIVGNGGTQTNLTGGTITINGGLLSTALDSYLGAASLPMVMNGGGLQATGTITFSALREVTLQAAGGRFDVTGANTLTVPGVVSGAGELVKIGSGTLVLSGTNGYSGGTTVAEGTLRLTSTNGAGSGAVALTGGTLSLFRSSGTTTYANAISVAAGEAGTLRVDGAPTAAGYGVNSTYATGTITADGTLTVSRLTGGNGQTVFNGVLVGSGTLVVDNTNGGGIPVNGTSNGRALFSGTGNTFSGDVVIRNGGNLNNNTPNPSYRSVDIGVDSLLTIDGLTTTTIDRLTGAGTVIKNSVNNTATLSVTEGDFSGVISIGGGVFNSQGTIALAKTGTGTLSLSGGNTYTGATTVTGGTLQIGSGSTTGALSTSSAISVASGATLAFRRSNTITQGTDFNSVISGSGGVAQLGSGTLVLNGVNAYSGRTLISAGVLALGVNGSFANSSEITVGDAGSSGVILDLTAKDAAFAIGAGQMLSGGGTVLVAPDQQFLVQGTFSPGNSPGLFTFDAGTTVLSGTTVMEIFGTSRATSPSHGSGFYDAVNIVDNGVLQFGGNLTLEFSSLFDANTTFDLFTPASGSTLGGNFTGVTVNGGFYTGLEWNQTGSVWKSSSTTAGQSLEFSAVTGQLVIVPEPSTIALLAAAGGIALRLRHRRRSGTP